MVVDSGVGRAAHIPLSPGGAPMIVPSLFAADHAALAEAAAACIEAGARRLHFDVMDGQFVPALGLSLTALGSLAARFPHTPFDVHLMTLTPERHARAAVDGGAASVTFHPETTSEPRKLLESFREFGVAAGLAIGPSTPVTVGEHLAEALDLLLIMTAEPGQLGATYQPLAVDKLKVAGASAPTAVLAVDGALDAASAANAARLGASYIVCGASVFGRGPAIAFPELSAALSRESS